MTHGDKSKAKKAASKASASQKSKAVQTGKNGKSGKEAGAKKVEARPKASEAAKGGAREKAAVKTNAVPVKGGDPKSKTRGAPADPSGFSNPLVGAGFKRALKKFPNAFRRLTD